MELGSLQTHTRSERNEHTLFTFYVPSTVPGILLMLSQLVIQYEALLKSWAQCRMFSIKHYIRQGRKERGKEAGRYPHKHSSMYIKQPGNAIITILQMKNLKVRLGNFCKVRWVDHN